MTQPLYDTLRSDLCLTRHEDVLISYARTLYREGFTPQHISPSQMAALGERIRTAAHVEQAKQDVHAWLEHQLEKLADREKRGERPRSWRLPPKAGAGAETLGHTLLQWFDTERYLPQPPPADLDHLMALQRFWGRFYDLYRYEVAMKKEMPLTEPHLAPEKGGNA